MPNASVAGVPREIIQEWTAEFKKLKAEAKAKGIKKLPNKALQHTYNGVTYTGKWSGGNSVSWPQSSYESKVEGARSRKGEKQKVKLSSIEQMMVDNYYEEAQQRGLHVDHRIPISAGGPSNAPWNIGLMQPEENLRKGDLQGNDYTYEPFLQSGGSAKLNVNAIMTRANMPALGGFQQQEIAPATLPGGSSYTPPKLQPSQPVQLPKTPTTPKVDMSPSIMETVSDVVETATPYVVGTGAAVGGLMLNMAQGAASLLFNAPGP
jgi:hypothetical protein